MKTILEKQTEILYEEFDEWEDFKYKKTSQIIENMKFKHKE